MAPMCNNCLISQAFMFKLVGSIICCFDLNIWFPVPDTTKSEVKDISLYRGDKKKRQRRDLLKDNKYCKNCFESLCENGEIEYNDYYYTRKCSVIECEKYYTNNALIQGKKLPFCERHKPDTGISTDTSKKCKCGTHASYGIPGEKPTRCLACCFHTDVRVKKDSVFNNRKTRKKTVKQKVSNKNSNKSCKILHNEDDETFIENEDRIDSLDDFLTKMLQQCVNETEI